MLWRTSAKIYRGNEKEAGGVEHPWRFENCRGGAVGASEINVCAEFDNDSKKKRPIVPARIRVNYPNVTKIEALQGLSDL